MATVVALEIDQGSRWQAVIHAPVEWLADLTGYQARGAVKASRTLPGAPELFRFDPYMTVDASNNLVSVDIPADITAGLEWSGSAHFDMELFDGDPAHDVRFLQGTVKVDKEVTT